MASQLNYKTLKKKADVIVLSIVSISVMVPPYSLSSSVLQHKSVLSDNGKAIH